MLLRAACFAGLLLGLLPVTTSARQAADPAFTVTANFEPGRWLRRDATIELGVSPPVTAPDRVGVLIGQTDWTGLFERTANGLAYTPTALPLPSGEHELVVFRVRADGTWTELARLPLKVLTTGGLEAAAATPRLEIGNKGQVAEGHTPADNAPPRDRYQDFTVNAGIQTRVARNGWTSTTQMDIVGVTFREEALQYAERQEAAPFVDLASYSVGAVAGRARFQLGHVSLGSHRYLMNSFASRGAVASLVLAPFADLSVAGVNGSTIVGWNNFLGLNRRNHRLLNATLGIEAVPRRPGSLRVEATLLDGAVLPIAAFTQGVVNDAEESNGLGLRVLGGDPGQRLRFDAGYARSRFDNPVDPLLTGNVPTVDVQRTTREGRYLDLSYALLQSAGGGRAQAGLTAAYRHERVDPLYRSVGSAVRPDVLQNVYEITGSLGQISAQVAHTRAEDNLDGIESILKTFTRATTISAAAPLASLGRGSPQDGWLPLVSYAFNRTHQFADGLPVNSDFLDPSQVPDQVSDAQTVGVDWQFARWRAGYRFNRSFQDNRQRGRALADFENLTNTLVFGVTPHQALDLGVDVGFEGAENREVDRTDITKRVGLSGAWRPTGRTTLTAMMTTTLMHDRGRTSESSSSDANVQFAQTVPLWKGSQDRLAAQLFVRFTRQSSNALNRLFGLDLDRSAWTVNTGLNLRVF